MTHFHAQIRTVTELHYAQLVGPVLSAARTGPPWYTSITHRLFVADPLVTGVLIMPVVTAGFYSNYFSDTPRCASLPETLS